jgi:hypothetical protein
MNTKLELLLRLLAAVGASAAGCSQPATLPPCEQPRPDHGPTMNAGSELRIGNSWGVLALTLHAASYDWRFVAASGAVLDSGTGRCHGLHAP